MTRSPSAAAAMDPSRPRAQTGTGSPVAGRKRGSAWP